MVRGSDVLGGHEEKGAFWKWRCVHICMDQAYLEKVLTLLHSHGSLAHIYTLSISKSQMANSFMLQTFHHYGM
jgi:hypothetical protein